MLAGRRLSGGRWIRSTPNSGMPASAPNFFINRRRVVRLIGRFYLDRKIGPGKDAAGLDWKIVPGKDPRAFRRLGGRSLPTEPRLMVAGMIRLSRRRPTDDHGVTRLIRNRLPGSKPVWNYLLGDVTPGRLLSRPPPYGRSGCS